MEDEDHDAGTCGLPHCPRCEEFWRDEMSDNDFDLERGN